MYTVFEQSVLKTLAFFDIFEYPLTKEELYRFLWHDVETPPLTYDAFVKSLYNMQSRERVGCAGGFYFLRGSRNHVDIRQRKVRIIEHKLRIAQRAMWLLKYIPFLRSVFICNTVALGSADKGSDIDLFIITRASHVWFVRMAATLLLKLFGLRTSRNKTQDKICLSFYVSERSLSCESLQLVRPDMYLVYWIATLIPLYDPDRLYTSMFRANMWMNEYVPNQLQEYVPTERLEVSDTVWSIKIKRFGERLLSGERGMRIGRLAKKVQLPRIKQYYGDVEKMHDTRVIITDSILKFHENDRRTQFFDAWLKRCTALGIYDSELQTVSTKVSDCI